MTRLTFLPVLSVMVMTALVPASVRAGFEFVSPNNNAARNAMPAVKTEMPVVPVPPVESAPLPEAMMNSADPVMDPVPPQAAAVTPAETTPLLQGPPPTQLTPVSKDLSAMTLQDRRPPVRQAVVPAPIEPIEPEPVPVAAPVVESAPVVNSVIAADADTGSVVEGFGSQVPLVLALGQIVPPNYRYSFGDNVSPGMRVSWSGGKPWKLILADLAQANGMNVDIVSNVVAFRRQDMPSSMGQTAPANTPINTVADAAPVENMSADAAPPTPAVIPVFPPVEEPAPSAPQNLLQKSSAKPERKIELYEEASTPVMPVNTKASQEIVVSKSETVTSELPEISAPVPAAAIVAAPAPAAIAQPLSPPSPLREPIFDNPVLPAPTRSAYNETATASPKPDVVAENAGEIIFDEQVSILAAPVQANPKDEPVETLASIRDEDIMLDETAPVAPNNESDMLPMTADLDMPLPSNEQLFSDVISRNAAAVQPQPVQPRPAMQETTSLPDIFDSSINIDEPASYPVLNKKILVAEDDISAVNTQDSPEAKKKISELAPAGGTMIATASSSNYYQELKQAQATTPEHLDLFDKSPAAQRQKNSVAPSPEAAPPPVISSSDTLPSPEPLDLLRTDDASIQALPVDNLNNKVLSSSQLPLFTEPDPIAAPLVPAAPAAPAKTIEDVQEWSATKNMTVRQTLTAWSELAGVSLVWSSEYDYPLQTDLRMNASFADAVRTLLAGFSKAQPRPLGRFFNNNQAGAQPVLIIETQRLTN